MVTMQPYIQWLSAIFFVDKAGGTYSWPLHVLLPTYTAPSSWCGCT